MQDGWLATWNGIKSQIQASEGGYNTWKSQTQNFFKTYQNTEKATELAITSLSRELTPEEKSLLATSSDMSITYKNTLVDLRDRLK